MSKHTVAVLVGSLRRESFNLKLAKALSKLMADQADTVFVEIGNLPLFSQDLEGDVPAAVTKMKEQIAGANGVLIITPEYNRSVPGVLKNAIDWASRPYGKNSFAGKPVAIGGTSPGAIGSACAQQHLRSILAYLDTIQLGTPELYLQFKDGMIDADGKIASEDTTKFLKKYTDQFIAWITHHARK